MRRPVGPLVCVVGLVSFVSADQPLCLDGKVVASLDTSNRVVPTNAQGELLKSQGGVCYCLEAADSQVYLSCDDNQWPTIAQLPPDRPMMCASGRNTEGLPECPKSYSKLYLNLIKSYDLVSTSRGTQQTAICDRATGTKVGAMEKDLFRRDATNGNTQFDAVPGCSCKGKHWKDRAFTCSPWPTSLSESYKDGDGKLLCVDGLTCPVPPS